MKDELIIDYKSNKISIELSYGYLDKIYESYNYKTEQKESIEKFILNVDNETFEDNQYTILEDIESHDGQLNMELILDGLQYVGAGKISKFFAANGLNVDLYLAECE